MLTIEVKCLPDTPEEDLRKLYKAIVTSVRSIPELGIKDEIEMLVLFPKDMMQFGLGTNILIEISRFRTDSDPIKHGKLLAKKVGEVVSSQYITARVDCFVYGSVNGKSEELCGRWQNW